jgi:hypothetical protein
LPLGNQKIVERGNHGGELGYGLQVKRRLNIGRTHEDTAIGFILDIEQLDLDEARAALSVCQIKKLPGVPRFFQKRNAPRF